MEENQSPFWIRWNKHYKFEVLKNSTKKMNTLINSKFIQLKVF